MEEPSDGPREASAEADNAPVADPPGPSATRDDAEARLRLSEGRLAALVAAAASHVVFRMSPDWSELLSLRARGVRQDDRPRRDWFETYVPADDRPPLAAAIERAIAAQEAIDVEHRYVRADGGLGWARTRAAPVLDASGAVVEWIGMAGVVTARKKAEAERERLLGEVRAERDRMAALLAGTPDEVWFADRDRRIALVNPATWAEFGGGSDGFFAAEDLAARLEILRPDGRARPIEEAPLMRALNGETVVDSGEIARILASGEWRHRQVNAAPVRDESGAIIGAVAVVRDVTDRKAAEAATRESEARFRALFENAAVGMAQTSPDGRYLRVNARLCAILGFSAEELAERRYQDLTHPDDLAIQVANVERVLAGDIDSFRIEKRFIRPDGTAVWCALTVGSVRNAHGAVDFFVSVIEDISERKATEAALRDSEERFRACFASAAIGFAMVEPGGRCVDANPALCAITGYTLDELRELSFSQLIHPADRPETLALVEQLLAREIPAYVVENRYVRKDGTSIAVRGSVSLVRTAEGAPRWLLVLAENVSDRVEAEAALREAAHRKDEFLAILAHELRNPLAPIANGLRLLQAPDIDADDAARVRDMMGRQVGHLRRLVDDLLDVSRISRGTVELRRERVDLATIVADAVAASGPLVDRLGHRLAVSLPDEPLPLEADPTRLTQAITNLLDNAAKFTPAGGRIDLTVARAGADVVVSVRDDGIGMSPEGVESLFGLFARGTAGVGLHPGGLGVGLALARRLVEKHGGRIQALSGGLGLGSEFIVRLPLAADPAPRSEAGAGSAAGAARRVLVVDDSRDVADSLVMLLESMGMEVRVAYDGLSALDLAVAFRPDIVFLDLGMPRLDGFETARRLRRLPAGRDSLLVALSGWTQIGHRSRARDAGFDEHIAKPADFDQLARILALRR